MLPRADWTTGFPNRAALGYYFKYARDLEVVRETAGRLYDRMLEARRAEKDPRGRRHLVRI